MKKNNKKRERNEVEWIVQKQNVSEMLRENTVEFILLCYICVCECDEETEARGVSVLAVHSSKGVWGGKREWGRGRKFWGGEKRGSSHIPLGSFWHSLALYTKAFPQEIDKAPLIFPSFPQWQNSLPQLSPGPVWSPCDSLIDFYYLFLSIYVFHLFIIIIYPFTYSSIYLFFHCIFFIFPH